MNHLNLQSKKPKFILGSSSQGSDTYYAKNPDYGAIFTFYLSDEVSTKKQKRKKREKDLEKSRTMWSLFTPAT